MNKKYRQYLLAGLAAGIFFLPVQAAEEESTAASSGLQQNREIEMPSEPEPGLVMSVNNGVLRPAYNAGESFSGGDRDETYASSGGKARKEQQKGKKDKDGKIDNSISADNPMTVTADRMHVNQTTGDVNLQGRVIIRHMMDTYSTEYLYGNTIVKRYVAPGEIRWTNPTTAVKADRADYDAGMNVGHFDNIRGWESGLYYFQGSNGTYDREENRVVVEKGYMTTRHAVAKVPDYRIEADSIEIYPGDHYTAYNVQLKAKNTTLITLPSYSGSLRNNEGDVSPWTLIPRPGFDSDNGFSLSNSLVVPINKNPDFTWYMKNRWYTKSGYKPDVGLRYRTGEGTFLFHYAEEESSTNDDGGIWVKKRPSFEYNTRNYYLGNTPFYVGASGEIGYWDETRSGRSIKGSYKGYDLYISSNPFKLGQFLQFNWKAGYAKDYYGYKMPDGSHIRRNGYYQLGLSGHYWKSRAWIYYTDRDLKGKTPYYYDTYSSDKPLDLGFYQQLTHNDAFSLAWEVDTADGRLTHRYWTYYRDMHSAFAWIRYDDVEHSTRFMIQPKDFRF